MKHRNELQKAMQELYDAAAKLNSLATEDDYAEFEGMIAESANITDVAYSLGIVEDSIISISGTGDENRINPEYEYDPDIHKEYNFAGFAVKTFKVFLRDMFGISASLDDDWAELASAVEHTVESWDVSEENSKFVRENDIPEFIGQIIDVLEDFLDDHEIDLTPADVENSEESEDTEANIAGSQYDMLHDLLLQALNDMKLIEASPKQEDVKSGSGKKLVYVGQDSWSRPVYKDSATGKLWKDVDPRADRPASLYLACNNEFDGEPDCPIHDDYELLPYRMTW